MTMNAERRAKIKARQMIMRIRKWDDPVLSQVCDDVVATDDLGFLDRMSQTCRATSMGVGLAAPQIGVLKRAIFIAPSGGESYFMLNPVILDRSTIEVDGKEGCLSYPGVYTTVRRASWVDVGYLSPDSHEVRRKRVEGFEAVIVQHEIDHLNGICRVGDAWYNIVNGKKRS